MADTTTNAPTSGQEPTAGNTARVGVKGTSYSGQAPDAGTDERSGTDGGRGTPTHERDVANDSSSDQSDDLTVEQLRAIAKAARKEAAQFRRERDELASFKKQVDDAQLSETEKLQRDYAQIQAQLEQLRTERQELILQGSISGVATRLGLQAELALRLIDQSAVAYDDNGVPTNIDELLQAAIVRYGLAAPAPTTTSALPGFSPAFGQPGVVARAPQRSPIIPATGATNPPRGGQQGPQKIVRSVHDIQWKRG